MPAAASSQEAGYVARPVYGLAGGDVAVGWEAAVEMLPPGPLVLAVDGPQVAHWEQALAGLRHAWRGRQEPAVELPMSEAYLPWEKVQQVTEPSPHLEGDPNFAKLAQGTLADLVAVLPETGDSSRSRVVWGPGASLVDHDVLWYMDVPKRVAEEAVSAGAPNLAQPASGTGTLRQLFYIDWPLLDRHRDAISDRIDRWVDATDPGRPVSVAGDALRQSIEVLARQPFRTQPTFNSTPWGGHWAQETLGFGPEAPNTALGYELIAPESGVLLGEEDACVEVPFGLVVSRHATQVMGSYVEPRFGKSFPIRFDYLDTFRGGNLSVHCHPQEHYMREVFGWPYTQHETYYVVVGSEQNRVFLGLRDGVDFDEFERRAREADSLGRPLAIEGYVQEFPARPHSLFLIPAGTPHGSGEGNVVLEVSATPYLYSLRIYDWLRKDGQGDQRAVHVEHAFRNLDRTRSGAGVGAALVQDARPLRSGDGWVEEDLGQVPEMFFCVRRFRLGSGTPVPDETGDRFHVLTVVEGAGVEVLTAAGMCHVLNCFETLLVPAAVGGYRLRRLGEDEVLVVKSCVV